MTERGAGHTARGRRRQAGQSMVELAIGSVVLLLLMGGLLDLSRVFFYAVGTQGAAQAAARHAAWFEAGSQQNRYLDDADVVAAVNQGLAGAGLPPVSAPQGTCPAGQGNTVNDPPYAPNLYPSGSNAVYLYICYRPPGSASAVGTLSTAPGPFDSSWRQGDVNVILLLNYGLVTGFMQSALNAAGGVHVTANAHFTIQGGQ